MLALSLYWGSQVLAGIVHVTASGTVGAWWFGASAFNQQGSAKFAYAQLKDEEKGQDNKIDTIDSNDDTTTTGGGVSGGGAAARRLALSQAQSGGNIPTATARTSINQFDQEMDLNMKSQKKITILNTSVKHTHTQDKYVTILP